MRRRLILVSSILLAAGSAVPASAAPPPAISFAPPFTYAFTGTTCADSSPVSSGSGLCTAADDVASSGSLDGTAHLHSRRDAGTEGTALITFVGYHNVARTVDKIEYSFTIHATGSAFDGLIHDAEVRAEVGWWSESSQVSQEAPKVTLIASGETFDGTRIVKATFEPLDALGRPTGIAPGPVTVSLNIVAYAKADLFESSAAETDVAVLDATYKVRT